ncbi:MAG: Hpt domain-containing protein [Gemmatimonadetes bacterium]|nr:Hpt domain-containing protein [Gemmatimonadota bacterium]
MTAGSGGLLDFFVLEAGECLEQLDGLLARAGDAGPPSDALQREARRLRGSATMARLTGFADLAGAVERVARALKEGTLGWDLGVKGALIGAVDDLKVLLHSVRNWGDVEQAKARGRTQDLDRLAPPVPRGPATAPAVGAIGTAFLALEADELAMALAGLRARPADRGLYETLVQRVRRLRGIAALKDLPPLGEVVEGIERALRPLERGAATITDAMHEVFAAATELLARATAALRAGDRPNPQAPEAGRFATAMASLAGEAVDSERVVPIATLFFADDGPHIVERSSSPPSTPHQRFRLEVVSLAEHLRRLVGDARAAADIVARDRVARELGSALRTLMNTADSFAEEAVSKFAQRSFEGATRLEKGYLAQLDEVAALLAHTGGDPIGRISAILNSPPPDLPLVGAPTPQGGPLAVPSPTWRSSTPTPISAGVVDTEGPPSGQRLHDLLGAGIAGLGRLETEPMAEPVAVEDDSLVPIEQLEYRGRAALERAIAIRDDFRRRNAEPTAEALDELFALLDLVAAE